MVDNQLLDLNLLRVFDAVYRSRNVSRAAEEIGMSQPATSQALTRLRLQLRDPLFERIAGGVKPTARAEHLALSVQAGLALLEGGVREVRHFEPATSRAELVLHLSDIGEAFLLPAFMAMMGTKAPNMTVKSAMWPLDKVAIALDRGEVHIAIGYLPGVTGTVGVELISTQFYLLVRKGHPIMDRVAQGRIDADVMSTLDYITARHNKVETERMLHALPREPRIALKVSNLLALAPIVRGTDLAVLVPRPIAYALEPIGAYEVLEPGLPVRDFSIEIHWSRRHSHNAMLVWVREAIMALCPNRSLRLLIPQVPDL